MTTGLGWLVDGCDIGGTACQRAVHVRMALVLLRSYPTG